MQHILSFLHGVQLQLDAKRSEIISYDLDMPAAVFAAPLTEHNSGAETALVSHVSAWAQVISGPLLSN